MRITNPELRWALAPVFVIAQILLVHTAASGEHPPAPPEFSRFPREFGPWKLLREDPIAEDVSRELGADRVLSQTFIDTATGSAASLFVAWFQTQSGGARQPHSPKVCLPAAGWTPEVMEEITLDTAAGAITVNRYLVAKGAGRAVVLYWYQTPRRVIAGEWAAKFWLVADAARDKRTDTALVRVITWPSGGKDDAVGFTREVYPRLRGFLPR
jgi:EpsI family protein